MITKEHYLEIADKYGEFASWAVWVNEEINHYGLKIHSLDFGYFRT